MRSTTSDGSLAPLHVRHGAHEPGDAHGQTHEHAQDGRQRPSHRAAATVESVPEEARFDLAPGALDRTESREGERGHPPVPDEVDGPGQTLTRRVANGDIDDHMNEKYDDDEHAQAFSRLDHERGGAADSQTPGGSDWLPR